MADSAPIHRLATTVDGALLVGAIGSHVQVYDLSSGDVLASTIPRVEAGQAHQGVVRVAIIYEAPERKVVVTAGEDKLLKVWDLPTLELRSSRELVKRATSLAISPDGARIAVADKFGDVYDLPLDADEQPAQPLRSAAKGKQAAFEAGALIAGHVSLLTSLLILSHRSSPHPWLITADRDEHIRVSAFPKAFVIHRYLLGHRAFVGALAWCPGSDGRDGFLISGGGENALRVWDITNGRELGKVEIGRLGDGCVVGPNTGSWFHKKRRGKQSALTSDPDVDAATAMAEDASEHNGRTVSDAPPGGEEASTKRICISRILVSPPTADGSRTVVVISAGSTVVATFDGSSLSAIATSPPTVHFHNFGAPVLDVSFSAPDRALFSLDVSRMRSGSSSLDPLRCLGIADGEPRDITSSLPALATISRSLASSSSSPSPPISPPSQEDLYPELFYFLKDGQTFDEEGEGGEATSPDRKRQKKKSQIGSGEADGDVPVASEDKAKGGRTGKKLEGRQRSAQKVDELMQH